MIILPDVNVLVYAFREGAEQHERYRSWLDELLDSQDDLLLVEAVLVSVVRIVTNPRIADPPAATARALDFVAALRDAPRARAAQPSAAVWAALQGFVDEDRMIRANLVPDAYLASVATSHRASVATADRGFARFAAVRWFDPANLD